MQSFLHNYFPHAGATAATDPSIATQMTAMDASASYGDEVEEAGVLHEGTTAGPLHDTPPDTKPATAIFVDPIWIIDEDEWTPDWAQAPPKDVADETGETRGQVSNNDHVNEDEPVTDGSFSAPPDFEENAPTRALLGEVFDDDEPVTDGATAGPSDEAAVAADDTIPPQEPGPFFDEDEPLADDWQARPLSFPDDETGETTGGQSNNDWTDEDETAVDGWQCGPLEDAPAAAVDDIGPQAFDLVADEDEPLTDGAFASPLADTPLEIGPQELGQVWDDDEPISDGWLGSPLEETPNDDILGRLIGEVFDDDEPVTDGWLCAPLESAPLDATIFAPSNEPCIDDDETVTDGCKSSPPDQDDQYVTNTGAQPPEDDEPLTDGLVGSPLDQDNDYSRPPQAELIDDDEAVSDGQTAGPIEDAPVSDHSILGRSFSDGAEFHEPDEPTDGAFSGPPDGVLFVAGNPSGFWVAPARSKWTAPLSPRTWAAPQSVRAWRAIAGRIWKAFNREGWRK